MIRLRPHHLLCTQGYSGKGYSTEFVQNMSAIVHSLRNVPGTRIRLVFGPDSLCAHCSHHTADNLCEAQEKVSRFDRKTVEYFGLHEGEYVYQDLIRAIDTQMTPAMLELSLIVGNAFNRRLTPYEETEQAARLKAALIRARDEDGLEITGKLRDVVADILQTSRTKVARMDKINNSLEPEAREQFKAGKLGKSAAYETAKLPEEEQRQIAAQAAAGKAVKHKEVAEKVAEKKAEQAAARAEKAAKKAEAAQTAAAQAGLQAERAAESADTSATLTSAHMNPPEPAEQQEWTTRDWAIYHLRELMGVASYITEDDLIVLQDILMAATGRRDNERC